MNPPGNRRETTPPECSVKLRRNPPLRVRFRRLQLRSSLPSRRARGSSPSGRGGSRSRARRSGPARRRSASRSGRRRGGGSTCSAEKCSQTKRPIVRTPDREAVRSRRTGSSGRRGRGRGDRLRPVHVLGGRDQVVARGGDPLLRPDALGVDPARLYVRLSGRSGEDERLVPEAVERRADLPGDHGLSAVEPVGDDPIRIGSNTCTTAAGRRRGRDANLTGEPRSDDASASTTAAPRRAARTRAGSASATAAAGPDRGAPFRRSLRRATRSLLDSGQLDRRSADRTARSGGITASPVPATLFPRRRLLTLYGAPQLSATILGKLSPAAAARRRSAGPAIRRIGDRPVIPGFDLIAVVANSTPGPDRKYRTRQPARLIRANLREARAIDGRLVLDIQPGRARVTDEVEALERWLEKPEVDISVDPEWEVGPRGVPGRDAGRIEAKEVNRISRQIQRIIDANDLPPKALVVHQFHRGSVRKRRQIVQRRDVDVTLNFDGIGSPPPRPPATALSAARRPSTASRSSTRGHQGDEPRSSSASSRRSTSSSSSSPAPGRGGAAIVIIVPARIVLFGATGYTGRLTAAALREAGAKPVLAARNPRTLAVLAEELGRARDRRRRRRRPDPRSGRCSNPATSWSAPSGRSPAGGRSPSRRRSTPAAPTSTRPANRTSSAVSSRSGGRSASRRARRCWPRSATMVPGTSRGPRPRGGGGGRPLGRDRRLPHRRAGWAGRAAAPGLSPSA